MKDCESLPSIDLVYETDITHVLKLERMGRSEIFLVLVFSFYKLRMHVEVSPEGRKAKKA